MSGRFVRASNYRHVFGTPAKPDEQYQGLPIQCNGDGPFVASNGKFIAYASRGGGGPVSIHHWDQTGRVGLNTPKLLVHKGKVTDMAFNPFFDNVIATASEDCTIKITQLPDGPLTENITESVVVLEGHRKKVNMLKWHPTSNNILASISSDNTLKVWDVETGTNVFTVDCFNDHIFHMEWNSDGSKIATVSKDKVLRVFDPRAPEDMLELKSHDGTKKATVMWLSSVGLLATVGFTRTSARKIHVWDLAKPDKPLKIVDIDQAAGIFNCHYDADNSIIYLAGKGDSSIRYYEVTKEAPYVFPLATFSDTSSTKGICWLPKSKLDVPNCEIAKAVRLLERDIVPVSFRVPRKSDMFQDDIFPDTAAPVPAQEAAAYVEGHNAAPIMQSMNPAKSGQVQKAVFKVKKSYVELEKELATAQARIAELEAQLA